MWDTPMDNQHQSNYRLEPTEQLSEKLEIDPRTIDITALKGLLPATVKVSQADYVPSAIHVRARISPNLFTADIPVDAIERLEADPLVISVGIARRLRSLQS
jgi:hypothetical protein